MSSNDVNTNEDAEMTDCEGERVVTMMDVLQEQEEFEEDANAVLGASDDKNCTYSKGYVKRQAIYACLTCCSGARNDPTQRAGVCLACSLSCHENHELIELYTKRNFRCDCGNPKFNSHPCQFTSNKMDLNEGNSYNQNFGGVYCVCHRPYPDPESTVEDEMIQCIICEDWLHASHLESTVPANDQYAEMICKTCMEKNEFLHDYSNFAVNVDNVDVDITGTDLNETSTTCSNYIIEKVNGTTEHSDYIMDKTLEANVPDTDFKQTEEVELEKTEGTYLNETGTTCNSDLKDKLNGTTEPSDHIIDKTLEANVPDADIKQTENVEIEKTEDTNLNETSTTSNNDLLEKLNGTTDYMVDKTIKVNLPDAGVKLAENDIEVTADASNTINAPEDMETETKTSCEKTGEVKADDDVSIPMVQAGKTDEDSTESPACTDSQTELDTGETEGTEIPELQTEMAAKTHIESTIVKDEVHESEKSMSNEKSAETAEKDEYKANKLTNVADNSGDKTDDSSEHNITEEANENIAPTKPEEKEQIADTESDEDNIEAENVEKNSEINNEHSVAEDLKEKNVSTDSSNKSELKETDHNIISPENKTMDEKSYVTNDTDITGSENNSDKENNEPTKNINENKRKVLMEDEVAPKKSKLDVTENCLRPRGVKMVYKGATFWPSNFRQKLCTCNQCLDMYKDLSVLFLIDPDDTVTAYETLGKEKVNGAPSQYEKGLQALSSLDRVQQINALTEYNRMRDKLVDFLKSFKDRKEIVKEEDIRAFFAGMKPKREPDGVYFCR